jgi:hypothetical protein
MERSDEAACCWGEVNDGKSYALCRAAGAKESTGTGSERKRDGLCSRRRGCYRMAYSSRPLPQTAPRERLRINLRALRNAHGLTVQRAATLVKVHWRHWQTIEAGEVNVSLETLERLARAMKVEAGELLRDPLRILN